MAQDVFLKAYRGLAGFKGEAKFSTWLFQIARHVAWDSKAQAFEDECESTGWVEHSGELNVDLTRALRQIPASEREALLLNSLEGFSHEEIAQILQVPVGTVKSRIAQAKVKLVQWLTPQEVALNGY